MTRTSEQDRSRPIEDAYVWTTTTGGRIAQGRCELMDDGSAGKRRHSRLRLSRGDGDVSIAEFT
jgi:hypothetical protein